MIIIYTILFALISTAVYVLLNKSENRSIKERLYGSVNVSAKRKPEKRIDLKDFKKGILDLFKPIVSTMATEKKRSGNIKQILLEAGYPSDSDDILRIMTYKVLLTVSGVILSLIFLSISSLPASTKLTFFIMPISLYILPDFILKATAKKRSTEISENLPDMLDLLTVCVEAGLGLDSAINRVSKEYNRKSPVLSSEFSRLTQEVSSGLSRQDAFRNLAKRNNVPELQSFVAILIQTDKLGTGIAQTLRAYSDTARAKRRQKIETLSGQASIKMTIPLILFIMPALFIVLLGPAFIDMMNNFNGAIF